MTTQVSLNMYAKIVADMGDDFEKAAIRGMRSAAFRLEGLVTESIMATKPYPPQDTGELTRSIHTTKLPKGAAVIADAPHAPFMEYGTRPHWPPIAPLAEWAYRKGLADSEGDAKKVAFAVAKKIAADGIEPRQFMARAIKALKRKRIVQKEINHELEASGLPKVVVRRVSR